MNILVLANHDVGLYRFRRELLEQLAAEHTVTLSLPDGELVRPLEEMGCAFVPTPVDRRGTDPIRDMALFVRYLRLLRRLRPDLVLTYTVKPNVYGGLACRMAGTPYAVNVTGLGTAFHTGGPLKHLVTFLYRLSLKGARSVFFENGDDLHTLLCAGAFPPERCCLLPGAGVDLARFSPAPYPADGTVRFLFMGRVMAEKGVDELLAAMKRLRARGVACTLDVLGFCEEDYEARLSAAAAEGWLRFHGHRSDVRPFLAAAHCLVLPSHHEGMSNAILECAATARPVIAARIPGCREAVVDGVSGFLCEAKSIDSLCRAMEHFCALSHRERERMGLAGRQLMERRFDRRGVVARTLHALDLSAVPNEQASGRCTMNEIRLTPLEQWMRARVQRYDHARYWRRRAIVTDPARGSRLGDLLRLWYIKRADAFHNASMGTHRSFGAVFQTPPRLPHGLNGIVVSHRAVIGANCRIYHQVTIGETAKGAPVIGDNVILGAGAKIIGPVTVGNGARIGAGCTVMEDIPAGATVLPGKGIVILRGDGRE